MDIIFSGIEKLDFVNTVMSKALSSFFFFLVSMLGDKVKNIVQALFLDNLLFLFYYEGQMHGSTYSLWSFLLCIILITDTKESQ